MSVRYKEYVIPEPEHFAYRPTEQQLLACLDYLLATHWILPEAESLYVSITEAKQRIASAKDGAIELWLCGGTTDASSGCWPDDEHVFVPELCEDVILVSSPRLLLLPGDMNGGDVCCPSCDSNILSATADREIAAESSEPTDFADGLREAPESCPGCNVPLEPRGLILTLDNGVEDDTPFCRFALKLAAAHAPAVESVFLDVEFLAGLGDAIGVPLRSTGREE